MDEYIVERHCHVLNTLPSLTYLCIIYNELFGLRTLISKYVWDVIINVCNNRICAPSLTNRHRGAAPSVL